MKNAVSLAWRPSVLAYRESTKLVHLKPQTGTVLRNRRHRDVALTEVARQQSRRLLELLKTARHLAPAVEAFEGED